MSLENNKQTYKEFCKETYVPIFSQSWWMDAVCGPDNWDVWLCYHGDEVIAAMPYYLEERKGGLYITKAPLTQNNGIIFNHAANSTPISRQKLEESIIDEANEHIESLHLAVYEQQYHHSFTNWLPFYWHGYSAMPRYTFVIEDTSDLDEVEANFSSRNRKNIRKGSRNGRLEKGMDPALFYKEHEKIFKKQDLECPFSSELWFNLFDAAVKNGAGEIIYASTEDNQIASLMFLVWDDNAAYPLLGGSMPEFQTLETYSMLTWESIKIASEKGLSYDFEGSMIKRIARSFREYGGTPKLYFRIRKVFSPQVILDEANRQIDLLEA